MMINNGKTSIAVKTKKGVACSSFESTAVLCFYCEKNIAETTCDGCGEPVCEDCCVTMTIHNQIDYPLCLECEDTNNTERWEENRREAERQEAINKVKKVKAEARKRAYWKPEAVEKRRLRKIERKREKFDAYNERMKQTAKIVSNMFKGML